MFENNFIYKTFYFYRYLNICINAIALFLFIFFSVQLLHTEKAISVITKKVS